LTKQMWWIEIAFSSSFKRAFKKRIASDRNVEARFWERVGST